MALYRNTVDHAAASLVITNKRLRSFGKNVQLLFHQFAVIVDTSFPVAARVMMKTAKHGICIAFKNNQCIDLGDRGNIAGLARMAWNPVQNKNVAVEKTGTIKSKKNDLSSEKEVIILQKKAVIENGKKERTLFVGKKGSMTVSGSDEAKFGAKVEVMALFSQKTMDREIISQRAFS